MMLNFYVATDTATPMVGRLTIELGQGLTSAWNKIGQMAVRSITHNFEVGGRPPWVPLSPQRIAQKGHSQPLIDTGRLMNSTRYRRLGGGIELYNDTSYGAIHQNGEGHVPARPWMVLHPEDHINFIATIDATLQKMGW